MQTGKIVAHVRQCVYVRANDTMTDVIAYKQAYIAKVRDVSISLLTRQTTGIELHKAAFGN